MNYTKLKFTSPEPLYAKIKESLRSYFESGAIDDLLFPIWTEKALSLFRKNTLPIREQFITLSSYQAILPEDFDSVKEIWVCRNVIQSIDTPNAIYYQKDCRVTTIDDKCNICNTPEYDYVRSCDPCNTNYAVTHKITGQVLINYNFSHLLRPGTISTKNSCSFNCINLSSSSKDIFDIHENKITTNFENGNLHLTYYSKREDLEGEQLIPEESRIQTFLEYYIYFKCFEYLWNLITDESTKILESKMIYYKSESDKAYIDATVELKRETKQQIIDSINRTNSRYNNYRFRR